MSAPQLGQQARAWAGQVDAAAAQADFETVRRRRSVILRGHGGGVAGEFFLDPVAGAELRTALDAIVGRPAADDQRTAGQRMADALLTMASRTLLVGSDLTGAQVRPHLALLVGEDTWTAIRARRHGIENAQPDRSDTAGGVASRPGWANVASAELEDGTGVPVGELERLMCDCQITRMVLSATGVPLDVGRTQ